MNIFKTTKVGKTTSVIVGLATAAWLSIGSLAMPLTAGAATIDELLAQITALQAQLTALQGTSSSAATKCSFTRSLTVGSRGDDVTCLQNYLKSGNYLSVSATGFFGSMTKSAAAAWQAANGVTPSVGYFGSLSQAKYNSLMTTVAASSSSTAGTTSSAGSSTSAGSSSSVAVTGGGLTITSATQPTATLAPEGAARLAFTKVTLTAGTSDVTVNGITVQRTGLANDAVFAGIILLDENGMQLGTSKTLDSNHNATVGDTVVIKAGASKTFTVAANMYDDGSTATNGLSSYAGQVPYLSVTGVTTSATVSGSLPITGAGHTINASLTIGSVTNARGPLDPNGTQSKQVGTTGYTFSSVKFTAGSAEKLRLKSIKWYQSGSAGASDLANIMTYVDGTAYPVTVSSDGKYYTSTFGDGIVVDKGNSTEIYVKGDIASGSGRTIQFDLYKTTDVYITGETYLYGITPPTSGTGFGTGSPWFDNTNSRVTISAGTITVTSATSVSAQNIAIGVSNQVLGGFNIDVKGEPISGNNLVFHIGITGTSGQANDITNISLYDSNGNVVAGPADGATAAVYGSVTLSSTVTFPVGTGVYTLKGKLGTDFTDGQTIHASTTPSSDWSNVTGKTTGNGITGTSITSSSIAGNTMTVKSAAVAFSVSGDPVAQTVVAGAQNFIFAKYLLNASASGEDVKYNSLALELSHGTTLTADKLTNCQLFDDQGVALNTGSNIPTIANAHLTTADVTFTLDAGVTVLKGAVKILTLKCNVSTGTNGYTYNWGIATTPSGTGLISGQTVASGSGTTITASVGQIMTVTNSGTLTVAADSSTPSYAVATAGSAVNLGVLKFHAANEAIKLKKLGLKLTNNTVNGTASSTVNDLASSQVTLWDGSTQVGSVTFVATTSTSTLSSDFIIPKDGDKLLTLKGTLANIGTSQAGQQGALVLVDFVGAGNAEGSGMQSGSTLNTTSGATTLNGVRSFGAYPTLAKITSGISTVAGTGADIYRFSVSAPSGTNGVGLNKLAISVATSTSSAVAGTTAVTSLNVRAYTDANFTSPVSGYTNGNLIASAIGTLVNGGNTTITISPILQIPAGSTYYFRVLGDITTTAGTGTFSGSVTTRVVGDASYPSLAALMGVYAGALGNFVWSPNATTTSSATHIDWTNGFGLSTLPSDGLDATTISLR